MEHHISRNIYRKLLIKFWKTLALYTGIIIVGVFLSYKFLSRRIWYIYDPEYPLLKWMHDYIYFICLVCILFGGLIISLTYFYKLARMIEEITDAVEIVGKVDPDRNIELPEVLSEVEMELNKILQDSRESRYREESEQRHKEDLIMYLAHDLKTPLTSILGYLTLLRDEPDIPDSIREKYTKIALDKTHHLQDLIEEFFDVTRINNSDVVLECREINFAMMMEQVLYEFRPIFEKKHLEYELNSDSEVMVNLDAEKFRRVLENLIKNAYNYSYENSKIVVNITIDNDKNYKRSDKNRKMNSVLNCSILNQGKTIPQEKLVYIFERFYRAGNTDEEVDGTGLGLAIAKRIVALHGGDISCESHDETITFKFNIPVNLSNNI